MKEELNKTKRLTIAVVSIVIVFIFGLLTFQAPELEYKLNPEKILARSNNPDFSLNIMQAKELIGKPDGKAVFVDIRNIISFERSHLENAINMPLRTLFDKSNQKTLKSFNKKGVTVILYGETARQAIDAWMMLQQVGIQNVKIVDGNSDALQSKVIHDNVISTEISTVDLKVLKTMTSSTTQSSEGTAEAPKKTVNPKKVEASKGGGC